MVVFCMYSPIQEDSMIVMKTMLVSTAKISFWGMPGVPMNNMILMESCRGEAR